MCIVSVEADWDTVESGFTVGKLRVYSSEFTALDCRPGHSRPRFTDPSLRVLTYVSQVYGSGLTGLDLYGSGFTGLGL